MMRFARRLILVGISALFLSSCGGGGSPSPTPTSHTVDISWTANREADVNTTGGGYKVAISGQTVIDVPSAAGSPAPTSTSTTLMSGSYSVTVRAYSERNATGNVSAAYSFTVPY